MRECVVCGCRFVAPAREEYEGRKVMGRKYTRQTCGKKECANTLRSHTVTATKAANKAAVHSVLPKTLKANLHRAEKLYAQYRDVGRIDYSGTLAT